MLLLLLLLVVCGVVQASHGPIHTYVQCTRDAVSIREFVCSMYMCACSVCVCMYVHTYVCMEPWGLIIARHAPSVPLPLGLHGCGNDSRLHIGMSGDAMPFCVDWPAGIRCCCHRAATRTPSPRLGASITYASQQPCMLSLSLRAPVSVSPSLRPHMP